MSQEAEVNVEQSNSDVSSESSSETQSQNTAADRSEGERKAEATPFHEHPRFKELIDQKNQFAEQLKAAQEQLKGFQDRFKDLDTQKAQKAGEQRNALVARLKGIDPEFGNYFEQVVNRADQVEQLQKTVQELMSWRDQSSAQSNQAQASSQLEKLYADNKVPKERQDFYRARIKDIAASNPKLTVQDLPKVFTEVHKAETAYLDSLRRQDRASYVQDKKTDASVPGNTQRGTAPKNTGKQQYSPDREEARGQLVQQIVKSLREQRNA